MGIKQLRAIITAVISALILVTIGSTRYTLAFSYAGNTPTETARIIINDPYRGMRAIPQAERYGDSILEPLREASNNFTRLYNRNSIWLAVILANDKSEASAKLANELWNRDNIYAKLVGAVGLAAQGKYPEEINNDAFIVKVAFERIPTDKSPYIHELSYDELAVLALGETRNQKALPYLLDIMNSRHHPAYVGNATCYALGILGDQAAISLLKSSLLGPDKCAPYLAFDALMLLGDEDSIPTALERIKKDPSPSGDFILQELEKVTGQSYGRDYDKWEKWWDSVKNTWRVPPTFKVTYT